MERLELLEIFRILIQTKEVSIGEPVQELLSILTKIGFHEELQYRQEIFHDITAFDTSYFQPEFDSWMDFLNHSNGCADYARVLEKHYTQESLEELWSASHIGEELTKNELNARILKELGNLKMMDIVFDGCEACMEAYDAKEHQKARLAGLYHLFYEV